MLKYYHAITDQKNNVHSIDMVYLVYYSYISPQGLLDIIRNVHFRYPELRYQEHLNRPPHSKYDYFLDGISIGGAYVSVGKYNNYDRFTKTFDLLPMFELRVNPNKYFNEVWFQDLLKRLMEVASSGCLRKFDYAIDVGVVPKNVQIFNSRKEYGVFKGTRYYGQSGRHGYLKIYDKRKDMARQKIEISDTTRIEYTFFSNQERRFDDIYILYSDEVNCDYSKLNDTDIAIVEMYRLIKSQSLEYELKLGRKKMEKLKEYILGKYTLFEFGKILDDLLVNIKNVFCANDIIIDSNGFMQVENEMDVPFI